MKYEVKILAIPFVLNEKYTLKETAVVTIYDEKDEKAYQELRFGYADFKTLSDQSDRWMDFSGVYFKDFQIRDYLPILVMEDHNTVEIFHAQRCFFDGNSDFSMMTYGKGGFSITNSYFGNGNVSFQDSVFNADITSFSANKYGNGFKNFSGVRFHGDDVQFYSSQFNHGDIDFKCSNFTKANLNFSGSSKLSGHMNFDFSHFSNHGVDFSGVDFGTGDATFRNCSFNGGRALFFGSSLKNGKMSFSDSFFGDSDVDFSFCNFQECLVHFKHSKLGTGNLNIDRMTLSQGSMLFKGIHFISKSILFLDSKIQSLAFINCTFSEHVNMQLSQCEELSVKNCIIEKTFDILASEERKIDIKMFDLTNTKNLGRIYIDWSLNGVKNMIYLQKEKTQLIDKANQFRLLKENFHEIGQYDDEDFAYVEFKRCQSKEEISGARLSKKEIGRFHMLFRRIVHPLKWLIFDYIGRYATNPIRILGAILITVIIFSGVYTLPGIELGGYKEFYENDFLNRLVNGLYHSIQSTFTLGYGDINPNNLGTLLISGLQSFIGVFLMSYFTAAFVRKLLR